MKKRRPLRGVLAALPIIVAYFLAFPYPLGREVMLRARWRVPLASGVPGIGSRANDNASVAARGAPFRLGDLYGFVSPDGELASLDRTPFAVALSQRGSVAFARVGTTWVLDGPSGEALTSFSGNGYPLLSPRGDRIFLVKTDLTGLRELTESGEPAWSRDFPSPITSAAVQGDWLAVGQLSGSVSLLDRRGAVVFDKAPAGSRIASTYGVAVTEDGSRLAAVTGIGPQLLTIWRRARDGYAAEARLPLGTDFRREVRLAFAPDARSLACEADDAVLLVDTASLARAPVNLRGRLSGLVFLEASGGRSGAWVVAARNAAGAAELATVRPPGAVLARVPLGRPSGEAAASTESDGPWLGAAGDSLLVAYAGSLLGIGLESR